MSFKDPHVAFEEKAQRCTHAVTHKHKPMHPHTYTQNTFYRLCVQRMIQ